MRRYFRWVFAFALVFGLLGAFSSVNAEYVSGSSVSVSVQSNAIYVKEESSGIIPYQVRFTVPAETLALMEPYHLYEISAGGNVQADYYTASGTRKSPTNLETAVKNTVFSASDDYFRCQVAPGGRGWLADFFIYVTEEQKARGYKLDITVVGESQFSWESSYSSNDVTYARAYISGTPDTVELWDVGTTVQNSDSDSLKEAIDNQTADINQNHQETMDKIDDITDFDEQEQSGMTGQVDDVKQQLGEKLGILSFADTVIGNFIGLFKETSEKPGLVFPGFEIEVDGASYTVWEDTTFDLSTIDTGFVDLMTAVRFATSFLVYAALFMYVQKIFSAIMQDWSDRHG